MLVQQEADTPSQDQCNARHMHHLLYIPHTCKSKDIYQHFNKFDYRTELQNVKNTRTRNGTTITLRITS